MIYYEPHPVSPERKAELRAKGFRIVDAAFAPADWSAPDGLQAQDKAETEAPAPVPRGSPANAIIDVEPPKRRGRPRKAD